MKKGDPGLALNCPRCDRRLHFLEAYGTEPDRVFLVYHCLSHGRWVISPDGHIQLRPESTH
jgi:hypothetical protein